MQQRFLDAVADVARTSWTAHAPGDRAHGARVGRSRVDSECPHGQRHAAVFESRH